MTSCSNFEDIDFSLWSTNDEPSERQNHFFLNPIREILIFYRKHLKAPQ